MDPKIILHPTDGSPGAMKALDLACDLARDRAARLIVLHAQRRNGWAAVPADLQGYRRVEHVDISEAEMMKAQSRAILDAAERTARGRGLSDVEALTLVGDPSRVIVETARAKAVDMIVMGSRGRGDLEGLLLGSVSHKVTHAAPCTCVVVR